MNKHFLISICIPSYNRPIELNRLLESIDTNYIDKVEIVICEDNAPKRLEVRKVVEKFIVNSNFHVNYTENNVNYGHGKNLRECIIQANGKFILFMGDDDVFIEGQFDKFYDFVNENSNIGYILRSYHYIDNDGIGQYCKYYSSHKYYEPGLEPYIDFFTKSVSMSGFTINREYSMNYFLDDFDETLLFQLYLVAEVCLKYPSVYCNIPCARLVSDGESYFGVNKKEKNLFHPGKKVTSNINFIKGYFKITNYIDHKYNLNSTKLIKNDLSKYSYRILASSRKFGYKDFKIHVKGLKELGLNSSKYFYIYYFSLLFFGNKTCDLVIYYIKKIVGRRLHL